MQFHGPFADPDPLPSQRCLQFSLLFHLSKSAAISSAFSSIFSFPHSVEWETISVFQKAITKSSFCIDFYIITKLILPLQVVTIGWTRIRGKHGLHNVSLLLRTTLKTALAPYVMVHRNSGHYNKILPAL